MEKIQYRTTTFPRREEDLFLSALARLRATKPGKRLRVLSFGCSIGDEVASLASIFENSDVFGCDVDEAALAAAHRSVGHFATIVRSDLPTLMRQGPFDFIAACSVLCLNPRPKDFSTVFPAARFDEALSHLDALLDTGGILGITNASYRFLTSPVADRYDIVRSDIVSSCGFIDLMERDGSSILLQTTAPASPFYRQGESFSRLDDEDFADALFEKKPAAGPRRAHWVRQAEVPEGWVTSEAYERENTDGLGDSVPADAVRIVTRYEIGAVEATGERGIVSEIRWPAIDGRTHVRPRTFTPLGRASIRRISRV